jgi:hypothetical protein
LRAPAPTVSAGCSIRSLKRILTLILRAQTRATLATARGMLSNYARFQGRLMRRLCVVAIVVAMAGGFADASPDPLPSLTPVVQKIESFIAAQRAADGLSCSAQGYAMATAEHLACMRDTAARRRAALQDVSGGENI